MRPNNHIKSFAFLALVIISGFILESLSIPAPIVHFPNNAILMLSYLLILFLIDTFLKPTRVYQLLTSIPFAVTTIILFTFLAIITGIVPQTTSAHNLLNTLGLTHLTSSWPFLFSTICLCSTLGLTACKRTFPFSKKNIGFLLNHWGLWIILVSGIFGSGDFKRLSMQLTEGQPSWIGIDNNNKSFEMPFAIILNDFTLEEFPAELAVLDPKTKDVSSKKNKLYPLKTGNKIKINNWDIDVLEYYSDAVYYEDKFMPVIIPGSYPAAKLRAINYTSHETNENWVSASTIGNTPWFLRLDNETVLGLFAPKPKKFLSNITVITKDQQKFNDINLAVNEPYRIKDWILYQSGYDEEKGKWSEISIVQAVKDPWLPVVYFGIFMLLLGTLHLVVYKKGFE